MPQQKRLVKTRTSKTDDFRLKKERKTSANPAELVGIIVRIGAITPGQRPLSHQVPAEKLRRRLQS